MYLYRWQKRDVFFEIKVTLNLVMQNVQGEHMCECLVWMWHP